ncbi:MAG: hypothetical protein M3401_07485 [Actinomycetota bacterium]|nr:hypothetical protein [Actinomycetota bacterium]
MRADAARLAQYIDLEDLAITTLDSPDARELADAMLPIRNAIADVLWGRELLVAVEIVDHLLFEAVKATSGTPVVQLILEALRDARVGEAGLLVFGVHSLGLTTDDLRSLLDRTGVELIDADWGLAITPQTNSLAATMDFLERVRADFGVRGSVRRESIEHWRRSRQARWLESNPLLVVRVAEAAGTYYGNEALLLTRLQAATVFVSMLAAQQPAAGAGGERASLSTYVINNQQTLDIEHYLVLSPGRAPGEELAGDCVPIHRARPDLVAMSELRIDLDSGYWANNRHDAGRIARAVRAVYRAYLQAGFDPKDDSDEARRNRRWFEALVYFQRSFSGRRWMDTTTLATAFELLLHNPAKGETSKRIRAAIRRLAGREGEKHANAFLRVYLARNEIVHRGTQDRNFDIEDSRRAFVTAFLGHVEDEALA